MTQRLGASFRTLLDKAPRLEDRLVILVVLGPEGLIITMSGLESFNCRTFSDMWDIQLRTICIAMEINIVSTYDLPQG